MLADVILVMLLAIEHHHRLRTPIQTHPARLQPGVPCVRIGSVTISLAISAWRSWHRVCMMMARFGAQLVRERV